MQSFLNLEILFLTLITPLYYVLHLVFTDNINVSLRSGHDFFTMIYSAPIGFHSVTYCINKYEIVIQAGPDPEGGGWHTQCFFKLGPNEKCVKGMQVRKQGLG